MSSKFKKEILLKKDLKKNKRLISDIFFLKELEWKILILEENNKTYFALVLLSHNSFFLFKNLIMIICHNIDPSVDIKIELLQDTMISNYCYNNMLIEMPLHTNDIMNDENGWLDKNQNVKVIFECDG